MPEYIERFFDEAYRSFGGTISTAKGRKGIWSINRVPPDLRKLPESIERRFGKIGKTYPRFTFDKDQLGEYQEIEFIGPGHPLFEGIVDRVLRDYGPALLRGAIFYNADATEPEVLWLLKSGIEDGQGRIVGQRLFAVRWSNKKITRFDAQLREFLIDTDPKKLNIQGNQAKEVARRDELSQRFGNEYWLYVVVHCKSNPELHIINDPASKLHPTEEVSVVRYMVKSEDWKRATE